MVDHLRNGVPLEDAPKVHLGRSLASLMNAFRFDLDEYWERQMRPMDGQAFLISLEQAGMTNRIWTGVPSALDDHYDDIRAALEGRSWPMLRALPDPVWKLLRICTGLTREEWESLPDFCRELLGNTITCPDCGQSVEMSSFGEPDPIDDPSYGFAQRISLVFRCPNCGAEVGYSIVSHKSKEFHPGIFGTKTIFKWTIVGTFVTLALLAIAYALAWRHPY